MLQIPPQLPLPPTLRPLLGILPHMSDLLGMNEPRTYLVLIQNNHEVRATGGFISALGRVTVENGTIAALDFQDSTRIMRDDVEYPWAPAPMRRYMGIELMLLRDANWSPDFPTTAQIVRSFYAQHNGIHVDGVVSIDLRAVELMVDALGPLTLEGLDEPLTGDSIIEQIQQFWAVPLETGETIESVGLGRWWGQRKDFMPTIADAVLERVESGDVDYARLAQAALMALDERAIQVWINELDVQEPFAALGWDGALRAAPGRDFLALVDSNLGYNKVDAVIERALEYRVEWPDSPEQPAQATATVTYSHPIELPDHRCDITPRYGTTYDDMTERCYFNYVRLYVPASSELIAIEGVDPDSITNRRGERKTRQFAGYFVLRPGEETTVTFTYRLPPTLTPDNYALSVQRQSGTLPLPFTANIDGAAIDTLVRGGRFEWE